MLMNLLHFLFLLAIVFSPLSNVTANYNIDCVFTSYDGERKTYLLTLYLPYNPVIVANTTAPAVKASCNHWLPKGPFFVEQDYTENACDLLWIEDNSGNELQILQNALNKFQNVKAIYTTTHFNNCTPFNDIKHFLESSGFTQLGHWYWENLEGQAMFIKNELFAAGMNTLHYSPSSLCVESTASENKIERFFQKVDNKSADHKMDEIDFIYMINLDERPEKFNQAYSEFEPFGIHPYRFSAVNGWKLSTETINQVGVKFSSSFNEEQFLGSIYRNVDGEECLGNEILRPNGETFFCLGMSRGAIGIVLSHLSILQDAYDSNYKTIWVMEDDVETITDPQLLSGIISKLDSLVEDWDILFTDIDTKDRDGNHVPCRALAARPNVHVEPLASFYERFYPIDTDLSRTGMRYGAYSMIVRRSGMEKILNYFKKNGIFIPYDMDVWLNPDLKMYCVTKDIVSHRAHAPTDNSNPNYLNDKEQ